MNFFLALCLTSMTTYFYRAVFYFFYFFTYYPFYYSFGKFYRSAFGWYFATFVGAIDANNFKHSFAFLPYLHNSKGKVQTKKIIIEIIPGQYDTFLGWTI